MVPGPVEGSARGAIDDLREHDREVLEFLSQDPMTHVGFQGIRRRLGIHPEQLSRALHRLGEDGLVQKTDIGYRVTPRALAFLSPREWDAKSSGTTILQTYVAAGVDLRALVASLRGTWIGPLRWYGFSEHSDELRLTWALEDGSIRLETRIRPGQLTIQAHVDPSRGFDEATRLGHLLFRQIAAEISGGRTPGLVS